MQLILHIDLPTNVDIDISCNITEFITSSSFFFLSLEFSTYKIMSSENRDNYISSFWIWMPFISFPWLEHLVPWLKANLSFTHYWVWYHLHSSHTLAKSCSKFSKPGFKSTWTVNFQMFKMDLEKAEEPEIKLPTSAGSSKKQESSRKNTYFCFTDYMKLLDCVDHNKL